MMLLDVIQNLVQYFWDVKLKFLIMKKLGKRKRRQHKNDKTTEDEDKEEDQDESKGDNKKIQQY